MFRKILDYITSVFYHVGCIELNHGSHAIEIDTCHRPRCVWLTVIERGCLPVCHGNLDKVGVQIMPNGFILHADIQSNKAKVKWLVK